MGDDGTVLARGTATLEFVDSVLDELDVLWAGAGTYVGVEDRTLFTLALTEVLTNIAQHSPAPEAVRVSVDIAIDAEVVRASVIDTAPPIDIPWDRISLPAAGAESGRGLAMAREALDTLEHRSSPNGNQWALARLLRRS